MAKRQLIVVRHAKSSWSSDAETDHERPLNKRGRRDAPRIAARLAADDWLPDVVISSDSERTRQTWAGMAESFPDVEPTFTRSLYHAGYDEVAELVSALPDHVKRAMVIGHNPGWEEMVEDMTGESIRITTANVVVLQSKGQTWSDALERRPWQVRAVIRPKEL